MPAVSFYAHYITENGKDKFLIVPFSVFFYLLFYLKMNESISLYAFHVTLLPLNLLPAVYDFFPPNGAGTCYLIYCM